MQLVHKNVKRDADGDIVGTTEVVADERDIARQAALAADEAVRSAALAADWAGKAGDDAAFVDNVTAAFDWQVVGMVARGEHPGTLEVDAGGNVTGVDVASRPEKLTLRYDR